MVGRFNGFSRWVIVVPGLVAALALALGPLGAGVARAEGGSCGGGWAFHNSLEATDLGWGFAIKARVETGLPVAKDTNVEIRRHVPMWPDEIVDSGSATFVPLSAYEYQATVSKADLGLRDRGDRASIHALFRIPGQPDSYTCRVTVR